MHIKAIIGLGNPGRKYEYTRHNIGFLVVDALCARHHGVWQEGALMHTAPLHIDGRQVLLVKPQTFMNSSGQVIPALRKQGIGADNIVVVHDELEVAFGVVKTRTEGSARGHNGLKSIIQACGDKFMRVRCGIGRPEHREQVPDYVLHNFDEPQEMVQQMIDSAVDMLEKMIKEH